MNRRAFGLNALQSAPNGPARRSQGGAKPQVQQRAEMVEGLAGAIYSPPAVSSYDDPLGPKSDMVDNLYTQPVNAGKGLPSGSDWFKRFWYGVGS